MTNGTFHWTNGIVTRISVFFDDPGLMVESLFADATYDTMSAAEVCDLIGKKGTKENTREKRIKAIEHIVGNEFLPHVSLDRSEATMRRKILFFSCMIYRLCAVRLGRETCDDRDHYENKRIDGVGPLFALQFRPHFRTMLKHAAMYVRRNGEAGKTINIAEAVNHKRITSALKYAMSTGNWGVQKGGSTMTGVAQIHSRASITATLSNLRRINAHINKDGKMPKPRQLHYSSCALSDCNDTL